MPILSSVRWRSVELNDGTSYLLDTRETTLDDPNPAEATYATRKDNTPVLVGAVLRESTIVLNINIVASTAAELDAKILALRRIFNPEELREYKLERQLPHEQYHKYVMAAARTVNVNRAQRRCTVTLQTTDMTWQDSAEQTQSVTLFATGGAPETLTVNYTGNLPVEPTIQLTADTPGSDGPTSLYYRDLSLWYWAPERVANYPIKVVENWDVSPLVSAGKMRSDFADISISIAGRQAPHNIVVRSTNVLDIWIIPAYMPLVAADAILATGPFGFSQPHIPTSYGAGDTFGIVCYRGTVPASATLKIGNEFISYNGAQQMSSSLWQVTITARGVYGSPVEPHYMFSPILFPTTVRVGYGYAPGYAQQWASKWGGPWPDIDYINSDNREWKYTVGSTKLMYGPGGVPLTSFNWFYAQAPNARPRELLAPIGQADPTYPTYGGLVSTYPVAGLSPADPKNSQVSVSRLVLAHPGGQSQRRMSYLRLVFEVKGGPEAAHPGFDIKMNRVRAGFRADYTALYYPEDARQLYSGPYAVQNGTGTIDTSYLYTDSWSNPSTHFTVEVLNAPAGADNLTVLRIKEFYIRWDGYGGTELTENLHWPHFGALGSEQGIGTGEFPVYLKVRNLTDGDQTTPFTVQARMSVGQQGSIDCQAHAVSGALGLLDVDYKKSNWLRLMPGTNVVQFESGAGTGQIGITLSWRNRY